MFAQPPILEVSGGPAEGSALSFILRRARALASDSPLARISLPKSAHGLEIKLAEILAQSALGSSGRYAAILGVAGEDEWQEEFSIRKVFAPSEISERGSDIEGVSRPYFNDAGLLAEVTDEVAALRRDLRQELFAKDAFSKVVFPGFTRHKTGTVISGRFRLRDERVGQPYPFTPEIVLENKTFGRLTCIMFGEGERGRRHIISCEADREESPESGTPLDRSGRQWHYFAIVLERVGESGAKVSAFLAHKPIDIHNDEPVARRELDGWVFDHGIDEVCLRLWRGGTCWLGPLIIEEL